MTEHPSRLIALVADAISRNPCDRDDPDSRHLASGCRTAIAVLDALAATTANYYNGATQTRSTVPGVPTPQNDPARPPFGQRRADLTPPYGTDRHGNYPPTRDEESTTAPTPCNACRHRPHPGSICSADLDGPTGSRWAHPCGCAGPDDTHEPAPCPDCAAGKHTACAGDSWDEQHDQPAPCPCNATGHSTQEHRA